MPKTLERRNNVSNNKRGNMVSIPMDQLNLKIIKDMISDADVKSVDMAKRYTLRCPQFRGAGPSLSRRY